MPTKTTCGASFAPLFSQPGSAQQEIIMSTMTEKMSKASAGNVEVDSGVGSPKKGERFRCEKCGMELLITADCRCQEADHVHFHCCGQEFQRV
jgi:hypothetical protein